jgi:TPP-dependent indolepyruvate ferredoxin oxidoreductase alpha subunit
MNTENWFYQTHAKVKKSWEVEDLSKSNGKKRVLDRMERWAEKTKSEVKKEEEKQEKRIHADHTGPGVPKFVGKYNHGIKKHEQELLSLIDELRDEEEEEVSEDMDRHEKDQKKKKKSMCSGCGEDSCVCDMKKSKLASRARNHGAKKSISTAQSLAKSLLGW